MSGLQLFGHPGRSGLNARFYFDVTTDGVTAADPDGLDLPSLDAARKEARTTAAEMAKEDEACPKERPRPERPCARGNGAPVLEVRVGRLSGGFVTPEQVSHSSIPSRSSAAMHTLRCSAKKCGHLHLQ
ncbi:MAG TPA: hypothetical protein VE443_04720, partial [Beijerinckiaceae bacterium]|nr:hypothetical protein [Beijerinckiaceae bacterium]